MSVNSFISCYAIAHRSYTLQQSVIIMTLQCNTFVVGVCIYCMFHTQQGAVNVFCLLEAATHVTVSNLTSCGEELSAYLQDFDNWSRPIIPPVQNCPESVFEPEYFIDGSTGKKWICLSKGTDNTTYYMEGHSQ